MQVGGRREYPEGYRGVSGTGRPSGRGRLDFDLEVMSTSWEDSTLFWCISYKGTCYNITDK